jgi:hypothetical protein
MFVAGLEGLLFGLMPLRYLDGQKIVQWRRSVWIAVYGIAMFLFVHVMLRPGNNYIADSSDVSYATVLILFGSFGVLSVALWAFFRFRKRQAPAPA